jgi:hypothetical protein
MDDAEAARWSSPQAGAHHHDLAARFAVKFFKWQRVANCGASREITIQQQESKQVAVFRISGSSPETMRMESVLHEPSPSCREIDMRKDLTSILNEPK